MNFVQDPFYFCKLK